MRGRNGAEGAGAEVVREGKSAPEEESAREGRTEAVEVRYDLAYEIHHGTLALWSLNKSVVMLIVSQSKRSLHAPRQTHSWVSRSQI